MTQESNASLESKITRDIEAEFYFERGLALFHEQDYKKALEEFAEAIELDSKNAKYHYAKYHWFSGNCHYALKEYNEAIPYYKKATDLAPDDDTYQNILGLCHYELGQFKKAIPYYKKAIDLAPYNDTYKNNLGDCHYELKEYNEAIPYYKKAIDLAPDKHAYQNNLGFCHYELGQYNEAIPYYKKAIDLAPGDAKYKANLGDCHYALKEYNEAIPYYKKATDLAPDDDTYQNILGLCHYELGQFKKAIPYYEKAIDLAPDDYTYQNNLGYCYYQLNRFDKALGHLQKAVELNERDAWYNHTLGICYSSLKQLDLAVHHATRAYNLDKKSALYKESLKKSTELRDKQKKIDLAERVKAEAKAAEEKKLAQAAETKLKKQQKAEADELARKAAAAKAADKKLKKQQKAEAKAKQEQDEAEAAKARFKPISDAIESAMKDLQESNKDDTAYDSFIKSVKENIEVIEEKFSNPNDFISAELKKYFVLISKSLYTLDKYEDAISYYQKALKLEETASLHNNIGLAQESLGLFDEAKKSYLAAIKTSKEDEKSLSEYYKNYADVLTKSTLPDDQISSIFTYLFVLNMKKPSEDATDIKEKISEAITKIKASGVLSCSITMPLDDLSELDIIPIEDLVPIIQQIGLLGMKFTNIKYRKNDKVLNQLIQSNSELLFVKGSEGRVECNWKKHDKFITEKFSFLKEKEKEKETINITLELLDSIISTPYFMQMLDDLYKADANTARTALVAADTLTSALQEDPKSLKQSMESLKHKLIIGYFRHNIDKEKVEHETHYESVIRQKKYGFNIEDHILTIACLKAREKYPTSRIELILKGLQIANSDGSVFETLARSNDSSIKNQVKSLCEELEEIDPSQDNTELYNGLLDALRAQVMSGDSISALTPEMNIIKTIYDKLYLENKDSQPVVMSTFGFYQDLVKKLSLNTTETVLLQEIVNILEGIYTNHAVQILQNGREGMIKILATARLHKPDLAKSDIYEHEIQQMMLSYAQQAPKTPPQSLTPPSKKKAMIWDKKSLDKQIKWTIGENQEIVFDPQVQNNILPTDIPNCYVAVTKKAYDQLSLQFKQKLPEILSKFTQKAHGQNGIKQLGEDIYEAKLTNTDERLFCKKNIVKSTMDECTSTLIIFDEKLNHSEVEKRLHAKSLPEEPGPSDYKIELADIVRSLNSSSTASLEEPTPSDCNITDVLESAHSGSEESCGEMFLMGEE